MLHKSTVWIYINLFLLVVLGTFSEKENFKIVLSLSLVKYNLEYKHYQLASPMQLINYTLSSLQRCVTYVSADPKHRTQSCKTERFRSMFTGMPMAKIELFPFALKPFLQWSQIVCIVLKRCFFLFLRENWGAKLLFTFAVNMVLNLSIAG